MLAIFISRKKPQPKGRYFVMGDSADLNVDVF